MRANALQHLVVGIRRHTAIIAFLTSVGPSVREPSNHHRSRLRVAVHAAHRAAAARAVGLLGDLGAGHAGREDSRAAGPSGIILSGGPKSVSDPGAPKCDPAVFELGTPGARHLLRHAADGAHARRARWPRRRSASSATRRSRVDRGGTRRRAVRGRPDGDPRLGEPRRLRRRRPRRASRSSATSANAPVAAMADPGRAALRAAVSSRSRAHRERARDPAELRVRRLRLHRRLDDGVVCRGGDGADPRAGRRRARRLRAERRRRFDRRGAHPAPGDRRQADVHLRGQRRAAARRGRADPAALRAAAAAAGVRRRRRTCSSIGWPASPIPSRSARSSARRSSTCSRRRRPSSGQVDFLAQGTLYPDVIESVSIVGQSALIKSHHNVGGLPERMRMKLVEPLRELFKDEVRAVGREARARGGVRRAAAVPGPGPGGADPRRGDAGRGSTCCAAPTRSSPRR